ncbi:MAG: NTP transferase domain-containing protein [candidate division Zixibacteria bacterium]|nr:NTP transferase domain-containing protein [candidate division Zixibacteria bacterium]
MDDRPTAVVLAGGRGTRLRPYTTSFPKPLMPVGDRPILEILLGQLIRAGFGQFVFATGHLAELIQAYFGDGSRWGVPIRYAREVEPLGTAGPLRSFIDILPPHFLVVNGDVLSDLNFGSFLNSHRDGQPSRLLTIATHRRTLLSEYGVLQTQADGRVRAYVEKPSYDLRVSEGIYAFSREALDWIPDGVRMDFPDLVNVMLRADQSIVAYEHSGLWLDIGRPEDYETAQLLVREHPEQFADIVSPSRSDPSFERVGDVRSRRNNERVPGRRDP